MNIPSLALLVAFSGLFLPSLNAADELAKIGEAKPQNGVFMLGNGYSATVLELKDGQFRYWFVSDAEGPNEPAYPLSGEYSVSGATITLNNKQIYQHVWTFRTLNGKVTLWRPSALDYYAQEKKLDPYGILHLTDKPAEEAWTHRSDPSRQN